MTVLFNDEYYENIIKQFNYNPLYFKKIDFNLPNMDQHLLKNLWICHDRVNRIPHEEFLKNTIFTTGMGISGPPHLGTISQIMRAIKLQQRGFKVQIVLGDIDAYTGKRVPWSKTQDLSKFYIEFIKNIGFDTKKGILRTQSHEEKNSVFLTNSKCINYMDNIDLERTKEDLHEFYVKHKKVEDDMTFNRKFSLSLMIADFIDLLLEKNYENVIVFLGIDEHIYVSAAEKVLNLMKEDFSELKNKNIGVLYSDIIRGLNDYPKMSKSFPDSSISVSDDRDSVIFKILNEVDGDKLEDNVVFQMMKSIKNDYNYIESSEYFYKNKEQWMKMKMDFANELSDILDCWGK